MSTSSNTNPGCECTGVGAPLLKHTRLQFLTITDPLLGSASPDVPDGPFNRELAKLQENSCSLADHFVSYLKRTTAVASGSAPAVGATVGTLVGAPTTPTPLAYHQVKYSDAIVTYWYNSQLGQWVELSRHGVFTTFNETVVKTLNITPTDNSESASFAMPTDDDNGGSRTWTIGDVKTIYLEQLGSGAIIGLRGALSVQGSQVTAYFDGEVVTGSDFRLVVIFERLVVS